MYELTECERNEIEVLTADLEDGQLFEDADFPACNKSITDQRHKVHAYENIVWKRPHEICDPASPELFVDGISRSDVNQGELSDCWFLSACAAMAQTPGLIDKVLPPGQELYGENYKGLLTFRFWRVGNWETVHIDDRLPTRDGGLIFARCTESNEFWLPLLEKAYAKFQFNYLDLNKGELEFAFINLTGLMVQNITLQGVCNENDTFKQLVRGFHNGAYLICGRNTGGQQNLIRGHSYTITHVQSIPTNCYGRVKLVRVRNPWGTKEWTGAWNDNDPKWNYVEEGVKEHLNFSALDDGEFWMSFSDFVSEFNEVVIAAKFPDFSGDYIPEEPRKVFVNYGSWEPNETGNRRCLSDYARNPQYQLVIRDTEETETYEGEEGGGNCCNTVLEAIQDKRQFGAVYSMAICVYKMPNPEFRRFTADDFHEIEPEPGSTNHKARGYMQTRFNLETGTYLVVLSISEIIDESVKYVLRTCSTTSLLLNELPRCG